MRRDTIEVDLYYHLLVSEWSDANNSIVDGLWKQIDHMNAAYGIYGIHFNTQPVDIIVNAAWANDIDFEKPEKGKALHKGSYHDVNIYAGEGFGSGVCSLPIGLDQSNGTDTITEDDLTGDGCHLPLSAALDPISGTPSHEVGHWFGLYHTFQGGCSEPNDYVEDTPQQAQPSYSHETITGNVESCPVIDTCPANPGNDPVWNFMDYTDCSHEFTPQQGARMNTAFNKYRRNRQVAS
ncbi:uncharacterized protein BDZ99DRAFT_393757 [Mytilinidion resinicola]|uniref:Peptidase M43 pregnancy-associated plasma-A domain-containing protein n=1 Tax=Mytilinidion resinicola TaxID=574789 RepID=A0A6A6YG07_9PEZI|nr:uncharacterized protein BDZ99DRAFT_393757 [Mytilinidion resinicola]KAF2806975.1 hypothetical protein BDZ99DRAFT_393757 [Mytilinidion resinicola]